MKYTENDINYVYDRTDGRCFYCDKRLSFKNYGVVGEHGAWEVDHFIPLASNGADQPYNWVPACIHCNTEKSDQLPWQFMPEDFDIGDRDPGNYL